LESLFFLVPLEISAVLLRFITSFLVVPITYPKKI
jgi:hypothetical protein